MFEFLGGLGSGLLSMFNSQNNNRSQERIAQQNIALQREFAQNGIQWRVADAVRAGIHPLAALGSSTTSFSPVSVGHESPSFDFSSMGQGLERALRANSTEEQRRVQDEAELRKLQLEKGALENDALRAELGSRTARTSTKSGQLGPVRPSTDVNVGNAKDGPRNYNIGVGEIVRANPKESPQDAVSKDYGDEGLPQIPGQLRFVRDVMKANKMWPGDTWGDPNIVGSPAWAVQQLERSERGALTDAARRRNWRYRGRAQ